MSLEITKIEKNDQGQTISSAQTPLAWCLLAAVKMKRRVGGGTEVNQKA